MNPTRREVPPLPAPPTNSMKSIDASNVTTAPSPDVLSAMDNYLTHLDAYRGTHGSQWCPVSASEKRFRKTRDPLEARRFLWNAMRLAQQTSTQPLIFPV